MHREEKTKQTKKENKKQKKLPLQNILNSTVHLKQYGPIKTLNKSWCTAPWATWFNSPQGLALVLNP